MITPTQILQGFSDSGVRKTSASPVKIFIMGAYAGMFVALAGLGSIIASATIAVPSAAKLASAVIFPTGLIMIVLSGGELFTGNSMIFVSVLERRVPVRKMLANWVLVYLGNLAGSLFFTWLMVLSHTPDMMDQAIVTTLIGMAQAKVSLTWAEAFLRGVFCNVLVCMAMVCAGAADTAHGKIISLYMPVMVFVLTGFEHCVANMFYIPCAMLSAAEYGVAAPGVTLKAFWVNNMLPVTLGNLVGGTLIVALGYWFVFLRKEAR